LFGEGCGDSNWSLDITHLTSPIYSNFLDLLDGLDVTFLTLFLSIILIAVSSSMYDRYLKNSRTKSSDNHFKVALPTQAQRFFTVFSMRRNWHIISSDTKSEYRELRFLGAIRALTLFGVIIGHCGWYAIFLPSNNPIFIEDVRL
jgi:hypothetical protein